MFEIFELPDGSIAECSQDVSAYLKRSGMALASDFSDGYRERVRYNQEKGERAERFADFVQQYKKRIWNE